MVKSSFQTPSGVDVATVTADEMQAVDHIAVEDVGIELLQMMENAGRILSTLPLSSPGGIPTRLDSEGGLASRSR